MTQIPIYLYVEDDPYSREALEMIARRVMKIDKLYVFADSNDFLDRVRALPEAPTVFLLDIQVAPLTGFEMLALLRGDPAYRDSRVIALTASVMNEEVELLRRSGFDGVIGKPLNVMTFPSLLQRIVAGESVWHVTD